MKKLTCFVLLLCMTFACANAYALTGADVLGLNAVVDAEDGERFTTEAVIESVSAYPVLQIGSKDSEDGTPYVLMLQNRLMELGYRIGSVDGQYGSATENAVIAFQDVNGLLTTGIADNQTQTLLFSDEAQRNTDTSAQDADVLRVQQMLTNWGFMTGTCDGIAGKGTETAVAEFKNYIHDTYASVYAQCVTPTPAPVSTPAPGSQPIAEDVPLAQLAENEAEKVEINGYDGKITDDVLGFTDGRYNFQIYQQTLQNGDTGPEVWRVQRRLRQCNYLYKPDGGYGKLTEYAIRYFQRKNNLPETGVADQQTQETLFSANVLYSEEYVSPYKIGVSLDEQRVYVFQWDGSGYTKQIREMKCSSGKKGYATPKGTFSADGKVTSGQWYYFSDYNCYAKYAYRIIGGIMFHSVLYNSSKKGPTNSSVSALGHAASHGCIRLAVNDAEWIFNNCPPGTTVVIR